MEILELRGHARSSGRKQIRNQIRIKIEVRLNRVSFRLSYVSTAPSLEGYLSLFIQYFHYVQVKRQISKAATEEDVFGNTKMISEGRVTKEMRQEVNLVFVYFSGCP